MPPLRFPIISQITQNHRIRGITTSFPFITSNLSCQSCPTVALTTLLSFPCPLPLLLSFIHSPLKSHVDNCNTFLTLPATRLSSTGSTLFITACIILISPFPCTNCKKALHTLAFPSFVAWCALMLVFILLLEQPLCSQTFAHTVLFLGILSPLLLVLKSYPFFRSDIITLTKSCLNPTNLM